MIRGNGRSSERELLNLNALGKPVHCEMASCWAHKADSAVSEIWSLSVK